MMSEKNEQAERRWRIRASIVTHVEIDGLPAPTEADARTQFELAMHQRFKGIKLGSSDLTIYAAIERPEDTPINYRHSGQPIIDP